MSSLKTPKAMFDALAKLCEGKNINRKMTLRNQPKNVKIQNSETIQSYFTRVAQIKEQLEEVEENVEEGEIIRGNLESKMGLIRKRTNNKFCELEFKNQ